MIPSRRSSPFIPRTAKLHDSAVGDASMKLVLQVLLDTSECGLFLDLAIAIKRKCPCTSPGVSSRTTLLVKVFDFCSYTWTFRQNCTNSFTPSPFQKTLLSKSLLYLSHRIALYQPPQLQEASVTTFFEPGKTSIYHLDNTT